jgi:putative flippase GtrA
MGEWLGGERRRLMWFVVVGSAAAAVHWFVAVGLVASAAWPPLLANGVGWLAALGVSFVGHHRLSFRDHGTPVRQSAARFFLVSAMGFAINEVAYAVLLRWSGQRYDVILAVVLLAVAFATWWLSRYWVFLRSPTPP